MKKIELVQAVSSVMSTNDQWQSERGRNRRIGTRRNKAKRQVIKRSKQANRK